MAFRATNRAEVSIVLIWNGHQKPAGMKQTLTFKGCTPPPQKKNHQRDFKLKHLEIQVPSGKKLSPAGFLGQNHLHQWFFLMSTMKTHKQKCFLLPSGKLQFVFVPADGSSQTNSIEVCNQEFLPKNMYNGMATHFKIIIQGVQSLPASSRVEKSRCMVA